MNRPFLRIITMIQVTIVFILLFTTVLTDNPCRFEDPEKGIIDLTTVGRTDGEAAYEYRFPAGGSDYGIFDMLRFYT